MSQTPAKPDWKAFERQLRAFKRRRPVYKAAAKHLQDYFADLCKRKGVYPIISGRAKSLESFAEKIQRPGKNYKNPINELTDLCGVRVVVHTTQDVERIKTAFEKEAESHGITIDHTNSVNAKERLEVDEFGYLSNHLILVLDDKGFLTDDLRESAEEIEALNVELQLRTLAQHAWADVFHEAGYKNEFQLPKLLVRDFARVAAFLEECDEVFSKIINRIDELSLPGYEAYISEGDLKHLAQRLEIYEEVSPGNPNVLSRLLRAYKSLARWDKVITLYTENEAILSTMPGVVRDVGVAYHKHARKIKGKDREAALERAVEHLEAALKLDPQDVDARSSLGGVKRTKEEAANARNEYLEALQIDPSNPYALGNYIVLEARAQESLDHLKPLRSALVDGLRRCREQIDVQVNWPWAWFDEALFHLCMGDLKAAIATYDDVLDKKEGPKSWMVDTHLRALYDLRDLDLHGYDVVIDHLRSSASKEMRRELGFES